MGVVGRFPVCISCYVLFNVCFFVFVWGEIFWEEVCMGDVLVNRGFAGWSEAGRFRRCARFGVSQVCGVMNGEVDVQGRLTVGV